MDVINVDLNLTSHILHNVLSTCMVLVLEFEDTWKLAITFWFDLSKSDFTENVLSRQSSRGLELKSNPKILS